MRLLLRVILLPIAIFSLILFLGGIVLLFALYPVWFAGELCFDNKTLSPRELYRRIDRAIISC